MKKNIYALLCTLLFVFQSCNDPEMDQLMNRYCECISKTVHNKAERYKCFELMDSIKAKYQGNIRKMSEVIEKTNECHN